MTQDDLHRIGTQPPLNVPADLAIARERAAVVRYLRDAGWVNMAGRIARGEHLKEPTPGITASPAHGTSGPINGNDTT